MNPSIGIANLGIDQNVFNERRGSAAEERLHVDVHAENRLCGCRMGRSWLSGTIDEEIVWFQKYSSERSANSRFLADGACRPHWFNLNLNASYTKAANVRDMKSTCARRGRSSAYRPRLKARIMSKTFSACAANGRTSISTTRRSFRNANLHDELNHVTTSGALTLRHQITPLTSIEFNGRVPKIDSSSRRCGTRPRPSFGTVTVTFDPFALIRGTASFGFRNFRPDSPDVPGYTGGTMALDLAYTLLGMTRFAVRGARDIQYLVRHHPAVLRADRFRGLRRAADLRAGRCRASIRRAAAGLS